MTGSRSSRAAVGIGLGICLAGCLGLAPPALAQTPAQAPVQIGRPVPLIQQQPLAPPAGAAAPAAPAPAAAQPAAPAPTGIQVESLGRFDPGAVGLLDAGTGGLGADMWAGSDRRFVVRLLDRLPVASPSPAQQDLTRRLLLSTATAPAGSEPDLFGPRVARLLAMGGVDDVLALAERGALNPASAGDTAARALAEANLLADRANAACALAEPRLASAKDGYWQQLNTYCLALADKRSQVDFNADLLREMGTEDAAYFALLPAVMGGKATLKSLPDPTPLHLAMLRKAGVRPPADLPGGAAPGILRALALDPGTPEAMRLDAAERAAAAGALAPDALAGIYRAVPAPAGKLAEADKLARDTPGPQGNALLLQAATAATVPEARARLIQAALASAQRQPDRYVLVARVYAPMLGAVTPSAALSWFALDAARALVAAGDVDRALLWFRTAHIGATNRDADALATVIELWPILAVADDADRVGYGEETLDTWWQVRQEEGGPDRFQRAQALLAGLQATGRPVRETALWPLVATAPSETRPSSSPQVLAALADAAAAGRRGETVLLAMLALGVNGPGGCHMSTVATVAAALAQVGLQTEARRFMVEAMLARGF